MIERLKSFKVIISCFIFLFWTLNSFNHFDFSCSKLPFICVSWTTCCHLVFTDRFYTNKAFSEIDDLCFPLWILLEHLKLWHFPPHLSFHSPRLSEAHLHVPQEGEGGCGARTQIASSLDCPHAWARLLQAWRLFIQPEERPLTACWGGLSSGASDFVSAAWTKGLKTSKKLQTPWKQTKQGAVFQNDGKLSKGTRQTSRGKVSRKNKEQTKGTPLKMQWFTADWRKVQPEKVWDVTFSDT